MRIDSTTSNAQNSSGTGTSGASQTEFLKLFVAQLEHQNPLDPQDGAEFVAQLAQFSQVEQAAQANQRLDSILAGQISASNAALASFVGRSGKVSAETFSVAGNNEGLPPMSVDLPAATKSVDVTIRDEKGNIVRSISLGATNSGPVAIPFDGTDSAGKPLAKGAYTVEVLAKNAQGEPLTGTPTFNGKITAIDFSSGNPQLQIANILCFPSSIIALQ